MPCRTSSDVTLMALPNAFPYISTESEMRTDKQSKTSHELGLATEWWGEFGTWHRTCWTSWIQLHTQLSGNRWPLGFPKVHVSIQCSPGQRVYTVNHTRNASTFYNNIKTYVVQKETISHSVIYYHCDTHLVFVNSWTAVLTCGVAGRPCATLHTDIYAGRVAVRVVHFNVPTEDLGLWCASSEQFRRRLFHSLIAQP